MPQRPEPKNVSRPLGLFLRLWNSYWMLPALMVAGAMLIFALLRWIDGAGAADWLDMRNLVLTKSGTTMADGAQVAVGVASAIATLYVSITLLVLTIAAGNLGVRLIDRWIERPFIRFTLAFFLTVLAYSLVFLLAVDETASDEALPHLPALALAAMLLVEIVWLALALQDLGKAVFVDTAIARIRDDVIEHRPPDFERILLEDWSEPHAFGARWQGYIETTDIHLLSKLATRFDTEFRLLRSAGDHVLPGEALLHARRRLTQDEEDAVAKAFAVRATRSDQEGLSYRIRLLVEIAARALSPAVNDFYTARACCDALAEIMLHQKDRLVEPGQMLREVDRVACPTASFERLFDAPLAALRQAAADYPAIVIRMIERMGVAARLGEDARLTAHLARYAAALRDHGMQRAEMESDAEDMARAYRDAFER